MATGRIGKRAVDAMRSAGVAGFLWDEDVLVDPKPTPEGHGPAPGSDIARHLARHDFAVEVHREVSGGLFVSDVLEQFALADGADLLAIGGYAHSRVREIFLGGVTRDLIEHARVPVLLAR